MIKANELRVGSLILSAFKNVETVRSIHGHEGYKNNPDIHEIYKHLISVEENGNQYNLGEINPIALTFDWLSKFGFKKREGQNIMWDRENFSIGYYGNTSAGWIVECLKKKVSTVYSHMNYIHQLQNLYFDLVEKELVI